MPVEPTPLTYDKLKQAVRGSAAAVRLRSRLQPAGGNGAKVFPPTYIGGVYATEERRVGDEVVKCVLLDSVQSQANRLEQSLLAAHTARGGKLTFPLIVVEFPAKSGTTDLVDIGEVTSLDAPHRVFDAILRDSTLGDRPFRAQLKAGGARDTTAISPEGESLQTANSRNATPLFELCPTALVFGAWDSTGAAGGLGNKFPRAVASEIVGVKAVPGVKTGGRLDPTGIEKGTIYEGADGSYVVLEAEAKKENGDPVPFARKEKSKDKGSPAEVNHGNIPPDLVKSKDTGDFIGGGVTFEYAEQMTVLSLAALRRLRFPLKDQAASNSEVDLAARTVLAALALAAVAHQIDPPDYFLRSNCQLVLETDPVFQLVVNATTAKDFTLTAAEADALLAEAVKEATETHKLPWRTKPIVLKPKKALVDLVVRSRELGGGGEE